MFVEKDTTLIFLSPHLDDAVLSCGGLIWELIQKGFSVEVWTVSTMEPDKQELSPYAQMLHARWQNSDNPYKLRKEEDIKALTLLGCKWAHLDFPDCIYRFNRETDDPLIQKDEDLFSKNYQADRLYIYNITRTLEAMLTRRDILDYQSGLPIKKHQFIVPLGVGGHIDHRDTRLAVFQLGLPLYYYAEYPYAEKDPDQVNALLPFKSKAHRFKISDDGLAAWQAAVSCYGSQISSFWSSVDEMRSALANYASLPIARTLWKPRFTFRSFYGETRFING